MYGVQKKKDFRNIFKENQHLHFFKHFKYSERSLSIISTWREVNVLNFQCRINSLPKFSGMFLTGYFVMFCLKVSAIYLCNNIHWKDLLSTYSNNICDFQSSILDYIVIFVKPRAFFFLLICTCINICSLEKWSLWFPICLSLMYMEFGICNMCLFTVFMCDICNLYYVCLYSLYIVLHFSMYFRNCSNVL